MQDAWDTSSEIDIFTNAFHSCSIVEVGAADGFADDVPVNTRALLLHSHTLHDINELRADFTDFLKGFGMNKVLRGPFVVVLVHLPLLVDIQQGQVVTLGYLKVLSGCITFLLTVLWSKEDRGD